MVELMVVLGVLAVLLGILIPSLSKARESANRAKCLSNLRQIGMAYAMYSLDHHGYLPKTALTGNSFPQDVWYWQSSRLQDIGQSPVGQYLSVSATNTRVLVCPSDELLAHRRAVPERYPFSYAINNYLNGNGVPTVYTMEQVKTPAATVLVAEEDPATIDDANMSLWLTKDQWILCNLLAANHDRGNVTQTPDGPSAAGVPNQQARGNVAFCDGHAEFVARQVAHSKSHVAPDPNAFPNDPEILP
jgi:prepilin-type processing-associated H-X9-DG protein